MARALHESGAKVERFFSFYEEGANYEQKILGREPINVSDWPEMREQAEQLNKLLLGEATHPCSATTTSSA